MKRIDLNVDIGEGFPHDAELLNFATSANVCCGVHAGSPELTAETVGLCRAKKVRIGAHPGYPDRATLGRASLDPANLRPYLDSVLAQIRQFASFYPASYVKPHGGFYNDTARPIAVGWDSLRDHPSAKTPYEAGGVALSEVPGTGLLIMALRVTKLSLMGLPGTMHEPIAVRGKTTFIREGFADRAYLPNGTLQPRSEPGAVFSDVEEVRQQVLRLAPTVDSLCLHGDTPDALEFAELIYKTLTDAGYEVRAGADPEPVTDAGALGAGDA